MLLANLKVVLSKPTNPVYKVALTKVHLIERDTLLVGCQVNSRTVPQRTITIKFFFHIIFLDDVLLSKMLSCMQAK